MGVCFTELKDAVKGILSDEDSKALFEELKRRAKAKADAGIQTLNEALESTAKDMIAEEERAQIIKKRNAYINIKIKHQIESHLGNFPDEVKGLRAYVGGIQSNIKNSRYSTDAVQKMETNQLFGQLISKLKKENVFTTFNDKTLEKELATELWAENSSEHADVRKAAKLIRETYHAAVKQLNAVGADIGEIENYIARQTHNVELLKRAESSLADRIRLRKQLWDEHKNHAQVQAIMRETAYQRWKNYILPRLDPLKTFEGADPEEFLRGAYDGLTSGVHLLPPEEQSEDLFRFTGPGNRAKKVSAHRKLHFKDGVSWYEYNKQYGNGTIQNAVLHTLRSSGRNLGLMKMWGTNPRAMFNRIQRDVLERNRTKPHIKNKLHRIDNLFGYLDGTVNTPVNELGAKIAASMRAIQAMAKLGGVVLTSIPDIAIKASALRSQGVGALDGYGQAIADLLRGRPKGEMREIADSLGVWGESQAGHMIAYFSAADSPGGAMTKLMQKFFKFTGMEWWDEVHRTGFGTFISHNLAQLKNKSFGELNEGLQRALRLYGIEEKEWDLIRANPMRMADNRAFVTPDAARQYSEESIARYLEKEMSELKPYEIDRVRQDLEDRLGTYFIDQTDFANLQPQAADREILLRDTSPGTLYGELARFIAQFKYFSMAYARRVIGRQLYGYGADNLYEATLGGNGDLKGLAQVIIGSTILGYLAYSSKSLVRGLIPPNPASWKTWSAAMLQGGGFGIYGDFLFGEYNRFGHGFFSTLLGPTAGTIDQAASIFAQLRSLENPTNATFQLVKNNMPFLNLFYTRVAFDYLFLYGLQERIHPGSLEQMERRIQQQNNRQFWLPPSQYALGR